MSDPDPIRALIEHWLDVSRRDKAASSELADIAAFEAASYTRGLSDARKLDADELASVLAVLPQPQKDIEPFPEWLDRQVAAAHKAYEDSAGNPKLIERYLGHFLLMDGVRQEYQRRVAGAPPRPGGAHEDQIDEAACAACEVKDASGSDYGRIHTCRPGGADQ